MLLRTLGGLELVGCDFHQGKPLLVLSYLTLEGPKPRRFLAELFWQGTADPLNNLSVTLGRLRRACPGAVDADERRAWSGLVSDAAGFLADLEGGRFNDALDRYLGPFLAGTAARNWGVEFEEWVYGTREYLAARARDAMLRIADEEAAKGRFETAAERAAVAYRLEGAPEPEPEEVSRLFAHLLAGNSPRAADVRKEALAFEIPIAATRHEAREHLRAAAAASPTAGQQAGGNPPRPATPLVGREPELAELTKLLALSECRLLTLDGPGGVGKTRLAQELAAHQLERAAFADGVTFVPMDALADADALATSLALALGLDLAGSADPFAQLVRFLRERRALLILDNFEHLLEGAAMQVAKLLEACPQLKVLVTSRERLNLHLEWVVTLDGLPFPEAPSVALEGARFFDAVELFVQCAKRVRLDFALDARTLAPVLSICRLTRGMPLALELVAAWVRHLPVAELARELSGNLDLLATEARDASARHRSVRAVFEHSWQLLSAREQAVLKDLSVFRGGFRRASASVVVNATLPDLVRLVDASLLRLTATGRYDRHPLLYQFTQEKLAAESEREREVRRAHATYYLAFVHELEAALTAGEQGAALQRFEEELENLLVAWNWTAAAVQPQLLTPAVPILQRLFEVTARHRQGRATFAAAARWLRADDPEHRVALAHLLTAQASLSYRLGDFEQAREQAQRGLALARDQSLAAATLRGLSALGLTSWRTGNFEGAKRHFEAGLELAEKTADRRGVASFLGNLGILERVLGNYREAEVYYRRALTLNRELGTTDSVIKNLNNLGNLFRDLDRQHDARAMFEEGLELARRHDIPLPVPFLLVNLASVAFTLGQLDRAEGFGQEALAAARERGEKNTEAVILTALGQVATAQKRYRDAHRIFREGLTIVRPRGATPVALEILVNLAKLLLDEGQTENAVGLLGLVEGHPATLRTNRDQARRWLDEAAARLTGASFHEAVGAGRQADLDATVAELLARELPRN